LADPDASEQRIINAARAAGVTEFAHNCRKDCSPDRRASYGLSGGQVQRIALARAFLKMPTLSYWMSLPRISMQQQNTAIGRHRSIV